MSAGAGTRPPAHLPANLPGAASRHPRPARSAPNRVVWLDIALVTIVALATRLIELDHPPDIDEMHHVLAARSLLSEGAPLSPGGEPYVRAWLFTYLVAGLFWLFGESLVVARIPAVIAGAALVVVLFAWVRCVAGRLAAWAAALLLCFYPTGIFLSQLARFYTAHALFFLLGVIAVHHLASPELSAQQRTRLTVAAGLSLALALHLQITTAVGIAGLALWAAFAVGPRLVERLAAARRLGWAAGLILLVGILIAGAVQSGALRDALALFQYADYWAEENRNNPRFYHWHLLNTYPTLWTLFPLALVVAIPAAPRAAALCGSVFAVAFVFHSVAAWKHERFFFYAMPLFFAISGIAIGEAMPVVRRKLESTLAAVLGSRVSSRLLRASATGLLGGALLFVAIGNGAFPTAFRMLEPGSPDETSPRPYRGKSDWRAAVPLLRPLADSAAVMVSGSDLKSLYYLGGVDIVLNATQLYTAEGLATDFSLSRTSRRPAIRTAQSLKRVIACFPTGLVIVESAQWRERWGVPPATADYLVRHTEPVPLPKQWQLLAFRWSHPRGSDNAADDCQFPGQPRP